MGGSLTEWTLQTPLHYFKDVDTKWRMDSLSPDGDLSKSFFNTLGDMILEAFHSHYQSKISDAFHLKKKIAAVSPATGTSCESTKWETDTGMNINTDFLGGKK